MDRQRCVYMSLHIETAIHMGDWRTALREWPDIEKAPFDRVATSALLPGDCIATVVRAEADHGLEPNSHGGGPKARRVRSQ